MMTNDIKDLDEKIADKLNSWMRNSEYKIVHATEEDMWGKPEANVCVSIGGKLQFIRLFYIGENVEISIDREVPIDEL